MREHSRAPSDAPDEGGAGAKGGRNLVRLLSGDHLGVHGRLVEVQVSVSKRHQPGFIIVGLPGRPTQESRERIRAAIQNAGFRFPHQDRVVINLAPAFEKKNGAVLDLPVALGVLLATRQVNLPDAVVDRIAALGELGLDGELRPVAGALLIACALRDRGITQLVAPAVNADEVAMAPGVTVYPANDIHEAIAALRGQLAAHRPRPRSAATGGGDVTPARDEPGDFADVRGQESTKRGLLVAAAGAHNLLLSGPPGVGKTMLARRLPGIMPPMNDEETLDVMRIYSARGAWDRRASRGRRPFRAPHHTISYAGLVGGGSPPRPGEISLAHRGVLFLDELPEFQRRVLETLRQPLECGHVSVVRSAASLSFPARFHLVAAMNPCPCGFAGTPKCACTDAVIERYRQRISGPLLDRIDLLLEVDRPPASDFLDGRAEPGGMTTAAMREIVLATVDLQRARWKGEHRNGDVPQTRLMREGRITTATRRVLERLADRRGLSARALGRVLRIARTLADLEASREVEERHALEALGLHRPDWG